MFRFGVGHSQMHPPRFFIVALFIAKIPAAVLRMHRIYKQNFHRTPNFLLESPSIQPVVVLLLPLYGPGT